MCDKKLKIEEGFKELLQVYIIRLYALTSRYEKFEDFCKTDDELAALLENLGGLEGALLQDPDEPDFFAAMELLMTLVSLEAVLDRVEELHECVDDLRDDVEDVLDAEHLIMDELESLADQVGQFFKAFRDATAELRDFLLPGLEQRVIQTTVDLFENQLVVFDKGLVYLFSDIKKLIDTKATELNSFLTEEFKKLYVRINGDLIELQEALIENFNNTIAALKSDIIKEIDDKFKETKEAWEQLKDQFNKWKEEEWNPIKTTINHIDEEVIAIAGVLTEGLPPIAAAAAAANKAAAAAVIAVGGVFAAVTGVETTLLYYAREYFIKIPDILKKCQEILEEIKNLKENFRKILDEVFDDLVERISEKVALKIVGESYYKWNSVSSFYPTLSFIYKEIDVPKSPRRTQVKIRLPVLSDEVTDEYVDQLTLNVLSYAPRNYTHGITRANYVHGNKRFKTTIAVDDRPTAVSLLTSFLQIMDESLTDSLISYTDGRKRPNVTRRNKPLKEIPTQFDDYNQTFNVELYRVVLLINGLAQPIVLFP